jgi:hypothetical protein
MLIDSKMMDSNMIQLLLSKFLELCCPIFVQYIRIGIIALLFVLLRISSDRLGDEETSEVVNELLTTENIRPKTFESIKCPICLDDYVDKKLQDCGHAFCAVCITKWLMIQSVCPSCRTYISPSQEQTPITG